MKLLNKYGKEMTKIATVTLSKSKMNLMKLDS